MTDASTDTPPKTLDRFEILALLGEGAMAMVYKAFDPKINRILAIKVLKPHYAHDSEYQQRFIHEAKTAGNVCCHQNIATLYDIGNTAETPFMTMEYAGAVNLEQRLLQSPKLGLEDRLRIAIKVAEALDYAHRQGVVHRDIKPSNIICCDNSDDIRVTDFGIASLDSIEHHWDDDELLIGSPHYMSPEQITGDTIDGRSDIFSLGVLLYELVSHRLPFSAKQFSELNHAICHGDYQPLSVSAALPQSLIDIIDQCLEKSPQQRYNSAHQLKTALEKVLQEYSLSNKKWQNPRLTGSSLLSLQWQQLTLMAALIISLIGFGTAMIDNKQNHRMQQLALVYASTVSQWLARQSTEPLLLVPQEGNIQLARFIHQFQSQAAFNQIIVTDNNNTVQGSTGSDLVNTSYPLPQAAKKISTVDNTHIYRYQPPGKPALLLLQTPITLQDKSIGTLFLSIPAEQGQYAASLTPTLLAVLTLSTFATIIAMLLLLRYSRDQSFSRVEQQPVTPAISASPILANSDGKDRGNSEKTDDITKKSTLIVKRRQPKLNKKQPNPATKEVDLTVEP